MSIADNQELKGQPGELRMTLEITRAATGKTETVELIGAIVPDDPGQEDASEIESEGSK